MGVRRRWIPLLAAALVAGCGGSPDRVPPAGDRARFGPDALRYDLRLTHTEHRLTGTERIAFRNPFARPLRHVWIRAWDNAFGSCARPPIRVRATDGARIGARRRGCTAYRLDLATPVAPGNRGAVTLALAVAPPKRFDRFGRLGAIDVLGNALPVLAVSERGAEPSLPPYTFAGEAFFSLVADWRVKLTHAPGELVASTGQEVAATGNTVTLAADDERDFTLVVGPMERTQRDAAGIRIRWFAPRGTGAREARAGLAIAARGLTALQRDLGPYGARELDVLDAPPDVAEGGIAMEYPQLVLSPAFAPALVHELGHQWFFRLVGNDEWAAPWLDETLTSFAAMRLGRAVHGPDRLRGCVQRTRRARPPAPVDSDMGTLERRPGRAVRDTLYIEGPCALFNLQRRIGADRMTAFLRGLVDRHRDGVLTTAELRAALERLPTGPRAVRELRLSLDPSIPPG